MFTNRFVKIWPRACFTIIRIIPVGINAAASTLPMLKLNEQPDDQLPRWDHAQAIISAHDRARQFSPILFCRTGSESKCFFR